MTPSPKQPEQPEVSVRNQVLSRISGEKICPRGRWFFFGRECVVWLVWLFATVLSAVAVALSTFVIMHRQYALYEATHNSFWAFMLEALPYLWIVIFLLAAGLSYYHFRQTRRGYRYPLTLVIGLTLVVSLAGGVLLHYIGMSFAFDHMLGKYLPGVYDSQERKELQFWQRPEEGRLMARFKEEPVPDTVAVVEDVSGRRWAVDMTELFASDREYLRAGREVRLLGLRHEGGLGTQFHACGVFPWLFSHMVSAQQLRSDRAAAIERLHEHRDRALERANLALEAAKEGLPPPPQEPSLCADIAAVKRLKD